MANLTELALLSLYVYPTENELQNLPELPGTPGNWVVFENPTTTASGFSYGVFENTQTGEVVVAYTGTNQGADWLANSANGLGLPTAQTNEAALVAARAISLYGDRVSFTGHSLGGGLASMMAVWFNRPATVFDQAPFQLGALSYQSVLNAIAHIQTQAGLSIDALNTYNPLTNFYQREAQVASYFVQNEILFDVRFIWPTIVGGTDDVIVANVAEMNTVARQKELHSQALLTALVMSPAFALATYASPRVLPQVMNADLYNHDPEGATRNFLLDLIRSHQQASTPGQNPSDSKLSRIAVDFSYLGTNLAGLNKAAQDGIIAQSIEWYYWHQAFADSQKKQFFKLDTPDGLLQYTTAIGETTGDLAAAFTGAQSRSNTYVNKWLEDFFKREQRVNASLGLASLNPDEFAQWNIATRLVLNGNAVSTNKTQVFIGSQGIDKFTGGSDDDALWGGNAADELFGQNGDDKLYGGVGDDTLEGGQGDDRLEGGKGKDEAKGGAGYDTYIVGLGADALTDDSAGEGRVQTDGGYTFTGGAANTSNSWKASDGRAVYVQDGSSLHIVLDGKQLNRTTIADFNFEMAKDTEYLGIHLQEKDEDDGPGPGAGGPGGGGAGGAAGGGLAWL